jgi:hypothetical protein
MQRTILAWMDEVANDENYTNPEFVIKDIPFVEDMEEDIRPNEGENAECREDNMGEDMTAFKTL